VFGNVWDDSPYGSEVSRNDAGHPATKYKRCMQCFHTHLLASVNKFSATPEYFQHLDIFDAMPLLENDCMLSPEKASIFNMKVQGELRTWWTFEATITKTDATHSPPASPAIVL
jgi:hypothetical protein